LLSLSEKSLGYCTAKDTDTTLQISTIPDQTFTLGDPSLAVTFDYAFFPSTVSCLEATITTSITL